MRAIARLALAVLAAALLASVAVSAASVDVAGGEDPPAASGSSSESAVSASASGSASNSTESASGSASVSDSGSVPASSSDDSSVSGSDSSVSGSDSSEDSSASGSDSSDESSASGSSDESSGSSEDSSASGSSEDSSASGSSEDSSASGSSEDSSDSESSSYSDDEDDDPDKESDDGDVDDEDGKKIDPEAAEKAKEEERKQMEKRLADAPDCSIPVSNKTCGPDKNQCSSVGACKKTSFRCNGKYRNETWTCACPENRRGAKCESEAVTKHVWDCQDKNKCGGRGHCVVLSTKPTTEGFTVKHGCMCNEGFGGPGCHMRTGVMIGETENGDLVNAVPNNGGYFAFLELFRERLVGARQ